MRAKLAVFIGPLALSGTCDACLWFHGTDLQGSRITVGALDPGPYLEWLIRQEARPYWEDRRREIVGKLGAAADPPLISDHAAALVHLGELPKAIALLEGLEQAHRGDYAAAANLGTAYELAGEDEKALVWIQEAMETSSR